MVKQKWVQCTPELAENPERVKAWRAKEEGVGLRFIAYDKDYEAFPIVVRYATSGSLAGYRLDAVECLIEIPVQEQFITFYKDTGKCGNAFNSLKDPLNYKSNRCTHIVKLTFDGENFQVETVWEK